MPPVLRAPLIARGLLLLILAALDLELVVRPRENTIEPAEW
jgi:hypothetical protein